MYNIKQYSYIKHIDVQHYYIQNIINDNELIIEWVTLNNMLTDRLIKTLIKNIFRIYRQYFEIVWLNRIEKI